MARYLSLDRYDGSLTGLQQYPPGQYDVATPGGLSSMQHHWTRGFGGVGDRVSDVFAGTGDRYISGEYGSMYQPNSHSAAHDMYAGPTTAATQRTTLDGNPYYWDAKQKKSSTREHFTNVNPNVELIKPDFSIPKAVKKLPPVAETVVDDTDDAPGKTSKYLLIFVLLLAFITFDFWAETVHRFIRQRLHGGKDATWQRYVLYSVCASTALACFMYAIGIPIGDLEGTSV